MSLFQMNKNKAIKRIALNLPPFLITGYGAAENCSSDQIKRAMKETKCKSKYIDYAYAMFSDKDTFHRNSTNDYEIIQAEIADICSKKHSKFGFSYVASAIDGCGISGDGGGGD